MTENFFRNFFIIIKIACGTGFLIMIQYYKIEKTLIKATEHVFHIRNSSSEKNRRTRAVMAPPSGQLGHFILGTKKTTSMQYFVIVPTKRNKNAYR